MARQAQSQQRRRSPNRRVPLGVPRTKLQVPKLPGYQLRWINDRGNRIHLAKNAGWDFTTPEEVGPVGDAPESNNSDVGSRISWPVGTKDDGSPMRAYLMKIKEEFYREDQAAKQKEVDKIDAAMKGGNTAGQTSGKTVDGEDAFYGEAKFRSTTEDET